MPILPSSSSSGRLVNRKNRDEQTEKGSDKDKAKTATKKERSSDDEKAAKTREKPPKTQQKNDDNDDKKEGTKDSSGSSSSSSRRWRGTTEVENKEMKEPDNKAVKPKKGTPFFKLGSRARPRPKRKEKETKPDTTKDEAVTDDATQSETTSTNTTSTEGAERAVDKEEEVKQQLQQLKQQQQQRPPTSIVVLGGPQGRPGQEGPPKPPSPVSMMIATTLVTAISAYMRFWVLTSFTRWIAADQKSLTTPYQQFVWERLNDRYSRDEEALKIALATPPLGLGDTKWRRHVAREARRECRKFGAQPSMKRQLEDTFRKTVVVVEVPSGGRVGVDVDQLEEVVTFLLGQFRGNAFGVRGGEPVELEVVVVLSSLGGGVQEYGLAASQVERLTREEGIVTTVCVDRYACSGGYMIASQATKVIAAPFALVGSIGVIRETLHYNEVLGRLGIDVVKITSGHSKAPLTPFAPVTRDNVASAQAVTDKMHKAFQDLVAEGRPVLEGTISSVGQGDIYFGQEALHLNLVDRVMTSAEYIMDRVEAGDRVLKLHKAKNRFVSGQLLKDLRLLDGLQGKASNFMAEHNVGQLLLRLVQTSGMMLVAQLLARIKSV